LTDKIFKENPQYDRTTLIDELTELLEAEPVLIPWDIYEEYGHADGMVRYIGDHRVLLNNYCDFDRPLRKRLLDALRPHFYVEELHYGSYTSNSWAYINFLHVENEIFIPQLNEQQDTMAFAQIESAFPTCRCHAVRGCENIVKEGGALNCSTWNILNDLLEEVIS
jgi:agmatine/peptidylarginine deiminase